MAWERCDSERDTSGAVCRLEFASKRIVFNKLAIQALKNAKYLASYIDTKKRLLAFDILHSFEVGCSKVATRRDCTVRFIVNTSLVRKLTDAGVPNLHKLVLVSSDEKQVIFKW